MDNGTLLAVTDASMFGGVTKESIFAAAARIKPWIHRTPVMTSSAVNKIAGVELFFKAENLQKTGSFKPRGACNAVSGSAWCCLVIKIQFIINNFETYIALYFRNLKI